MNFYDENDLVVCQECNKSFHFITPNHLRKAHGLTTVEYREKYPDAPMAKRGFYNKLKEKKEKRELIEQKIQIEPIVEELDFSEKFDDIEDDQQSIVKLAERKIPIPIRSSDPMDDKIRIISYLKLKFPNIKDNYIFKKKNSDGSIECQFVTDMADPSYKIIFDFPNAFWHNDQIGSHVRNQLLKSYGWKIIEVSSKMPKVEHVEIKIKDIK